MLASDLLKLHDEESLKGLELEEENFFRKLEKIK